MKSPDPFSKRDPLKGRKSEYCELAVACPMCKAPSGTRCMAMPHRRRIVATPHRERLNHFRERVQEMKDKKKGRTQFEKYTVFIPPVPPPPKPASTVVSMEVIFPGGEVPMDVMDEVLERLREQGGAVVTNVVGVEEDHPHAYKIALTHRSDAAVKLNW